MSEELIIRHCSPTLAGLKTGNLFSCTFAAEEELRRNICALNKKLVPKGLRVLPLQLEGNRALIYVYRVSGLKRDLQDSEAREILLAAGYRPERAEQCVRHLMQRLPLTYLSYKSRRGFHESLNSGSFKSNTFMSYPFFFK